MKQSVIVPLYLSITQNMYVKVRKINRCESEPDVLVVISKINKIHDIKTKLVSSYNTPVEFQELYYKGKKLGDAFRVLDYGIELNDVLQLLIKDSNYKSSETQNHLETREVKHPTKVDYVDVESYFYKVGQSVDMIDYYYGAWFKGVLVSVCSEAQNSSKNSDLRALESTHTFFVLLDCDQDAIFPVKLNQIRPSSYFTYKLAELYPGLRVLVNYNIENPAARGYWYDFEIKEINAKDAPCVKGTLFVGHKNQPLHNCSIKFIDEIMRIEQETIINHEPGDDSFGCTHCEDKLGVQCRECGCSVCLSKEDPASILLCDECDYGFHISCLSPPLSKIPDDDWYCPDCKNDASEIVMENNTLKISKRKAKMPSNVNNKKPKRDWGRGMACVGRTTECTIVPKDHFGPIPGIDVGTCWKFRVQVSEAGIHRPHVAGIHGRENDGAYSLVLSGGYEDDVDNGEEFLYTGSGGRDFSGNKRLAGQSSDQLLTRMNKALAMSCNADFNAEIGAESTDWKGGKPVRVVRNYKLGKHSKFAPKDGNRYDGIYKVVKYYRVRGKAGFFIWRYLLRRDDPSPAPWAEGGRELDIIYPAGYLEAQENLNQQSCSNTKTSRKKQVLTDQSNDANKIDPFVLPDEVKTLIEAEELNKKHWQELDGYLGKGKQAYLERLQVLFLCMCCREVVYKPVSTECKHNFCLDCLKFAFSTEIYSCPICRNYFGKNYIMQVNLNLCLILRLLLPGYEKGRIQ